MNRVLPWIRQSGYGLIVWVAAAGWLASPAVGAAPTPPVPEFPPLAKITEGYQKVVSTADGKKSFYTLWVKKKDNKMLAELPKGYSQQKHYIALTVSSGSVLAGLQSGERYVYWKRYGKRLALIEPNITIRSTGDAESKSSVNRLFTDRVLLDVPIVTMAPGSGPVIDMNALLVGQASKFFGSTASGINQKLVTIKTAKSFPKNVEVAFEAPARGGRLTTLHYSISLIPDATGYKPRLADQRIGYFTTAYNDLGKYEHGKTRIRHINRWHLAKRDSKLRVSPPKEPIKFYVEHTTPVRYRRWVRDGVLHWNKAFEKIGLADAIEVYYQDAQSGAHMDKHPEDVRYNFIRWLNNDIGIAIGPSRVHPLTGQILDADIILTDGWIRHYVFQFRDVMPKIAMEGMHPETLAWFDRHPQWDPRIRLAAPSERGRLVDQRMRGELAPYGGHPLASVDATLIGDDEFDGLVGRHSQCNGLCRAADGLAFDMQLMRMNLAMMAGTADDAKDAEKKEDEKGKKKEEPKEDMLDGMPESFVGPLLADLVAHEVGHTLGLRHNFKASGIYDLKQINSEEVQGKKAFAGSVMDYLPVNMSIEDGKPKGDYTMIGIGPYDYWAIEYGYSFTKDLEPILARGTEPELAFGTDEDTFGPDPLARRYDFGADPLEYAKSRIELAKYHRDRLVDKFVKKGESWARAREGYEMTLMAQTRALSMMANWLGGAHVHRDKKGDGNERPPIEVVSAEKQRAALRFVIENAFSDDAFGLTPELLARLGADQWLDGGGGFFFFRNDADWPVHDRIMGIQASVLSMLLSPTKLRRVHDNEFRVPADSDMVTLPEILESIDSAIWSELDAVPEKSHSARQPMISSLRRNLQREHLERLIDLSLSDGYGSSASKPISSLARMRLRAIGAKVKATLAAEDGKLDPYSSAHLTDADLRITKALDPQFLFGSSRGFRR